MNIAEIIDHTNLKPNLSNEAVEQLCKEAIEHQFSAVCVPPYFVRFAFNALKDQSVKVATVIGYPMGYSSTPSKVEEIKRAIDEGADELDVVINICAVKNSDWTYVKNDIDSVTRAVHLKGKVIKIILETSLLETGEIENLAKICGEVGVDFVKTSTGLQGGATKEVVAQLKSLLPKGIKIKASGGIRTRQDAEQLHNAGADRLGCSSSIAIIGQ